ncbi:HEAT repeat domain-containing protein [Streptomyces sp. NPDC048251]|uniref:HEAT repeat domain-containing protein n=1 Tax=Streptomyces sp. NPDC048251 TaxID=3154501 RepID=UPI00343B3C38
MSADPSSDQAADGSAAKAAHIPGQVTARGGGAVAAGDNASHNATAKGATVIDNRTFVTVASPDGLDQAELSVEEEHTHVRLYADQLNVLYGRLDLEVLVPTTEGEHPHMELREVFVPPSVRADPPRVELPVELYRRLVENGELSTPDSGLSSPPGMDQQQWEQARQAYRERPAVALLDALAAQDATRIVLMGDPGAGKSTVARYLALTLVSDNCMGPLQALAGLLPVVVELRRYANADWRDRSFEDFLAHLHTHEGHAPSPALLRQRLQSGRALIVFDGLDELFDPKVRETVTRRITGFTSRYPLVRVVVTSRVIGYRRHLLDAAGFRHFMIQDLSDEQIEAFAEQWYAAAGLAGKEGAERLQTRLLDAIARSRPVRELAGNPLLLTILAIIARRQRLPRDRAGVYQHAVNVLIAHWDEDTKHLDLAPGIRAIADLDDRDRREMLERLARHMQAGVGGIAGNHVLAEDVEKVFTEYLRETLQLQPAPATTVARAMVNQFRERNFILSRYGSEVYGFVHRAFLEYLAASDIVRRYEQRELSDEDLLDKVFRARAADPHWHEVLLLIVAQTGERFAARAVDTLLELPDSSQDAASAAPPVLALHALSEIRRIGQLSDLSTRTAQALVRHLETTRSPVDSSLDLETPLGLLGPEWVGARHLLRWLHCDVGGGSYALYGLITDEEALKAVSLAAPTGQGRAAALSHLAVRFAKDPAVRSFVMERAADDPHPDVRTDLFHDMAYAWPDDPHLVDFLREQMTDDLHWSVRQSAVFAMIDVPNEAPRVRALLSDLIADPEQKEDVRVSAVDALVYVDGALADDDVRQLLARHSLSDTSDRVRSTAQEALAVLFGHIPAVREWLLERIAAVPDDDGTWGALRVLARKHADDPRIRQAILAYANDSSGSEELRVRAIGAFTATYWTQSEEARAVIRRWGSEEPSADTRASVLIELRLNRSDDAEARDYTLVRLSREPSAYVRRVVLERLAHFGENDEALLRTLQSSAVEDRDGLCRAAALETLSRQWHDSETVRSFVETQAVTDPNSDVRAAAQRCLTAYWPAQPTPEMLAAALRRRVLEDASQACFDHVCEQLQQSPHRVVRLTAAHLLSTCWANEPRTVAALTAQARDEDGTDGRAYIESAITTAMTYAPVYEHLF